MFYRPGMDDHGLPRNPFNALITPRPIGWVASVDENGASNLAPFSFSNGAAYEPPAISVAFTGAKLGELAGEGDGTNTTVFGQVVGVHISDDILKDGFVDPTIYQPLARMGYLDYTTVKDVFTLKRPE